jgi:hypothetical protein
VKIGACVADSMAILKQSLYEGLNDVNNPDTFRKRGTLRSRRRVRRDSVDDSLSGVGKRPKHSIPEFVGTVGGIK